MEGILGRIVAVVLGLLALSGIGLIAYKGFASTRASTVTTDITQIITNARGEFAQNSNGYTNFLTTNASAMNTAGIFPSDMMRGAVVYDPWGNTVALSNTAAATEGVITFGGGGSETAAQCTSVVTSLKDYVSLSVAGTTFSQSNEPDAVSAANACATDSAVLVLTFQ